MRRAIVTYAAEAHEELLDVSLPLFERFARKHDYKVIVGAKMTDRPPAWNKIPLLLQALKEFEEVVWLDCDLVIVNDKDDFPVFAADATHSLVRHFEDNSEVPNSGVWRLKRCESINTLLLRMEQLDVFTNHGWWEQAALMTLMGYSVPPEGSDFKQTHCRCVYPTRWYNECEFMRLCWNSHPNYRAEHPRIVHCSYPNMAQRLEVMRELVKNPQFGFPTFRQEEKQEKVTE